MSLHEIERFKLLPIIIYSIKPYFISTYNEFSNIYLVNHSKTPNEINLHTSVLWPRIFFIPYSSIFDFRVFESRLHSSFILPIFLVCFLQHHSMFHRWSVSLIKSYRNPTTSMIRNYYDFSNQ